MKIKHSPAKKRLTTLQIFYNHCCENYKNNLEGYDDLLWQVYNIIGSKIHNEIYLKTFYGTTRNNGIYLKILRDFIDLNKLYNYGEVSWEVRQTSLYNLCKISWKIRQTSMAIIKLINEKL